MRFNTEFRHGIFFIRFFGKIKDGEIKKYNSKITNLIVDNGFKNVVFNIENLILDDFNIINSLFSKKIYNINLMICGFKNNKLIDKFKNNLNYNYIGIVSDEFSALKKVNI